MAGSVLPLLMLVGSLLIAMALYRLSAVAALPLTQLARAGDIVGLIGVAAAAMAWSWFLYRLKRWEKGAAEPCGTCGGPLGRLREGKMYFGRQLRDFRRCYNCGKPNSEPE